MKYLFIGLLMINTLATIAIIGENRKPITKGQAIVNTIINVIFAGIVLAYL
jgi:hypothetical protein